MTLIDHYINILLSSVVWGVLDTVPAHTTFQDFFYFLNFTILPAVGMEDETFRIHLL